MLFEDTRNKGFKYLSGKELDTKQKELVKQLYVKFHEETDGRREKLEDFILMRTVLDDNTPVAFSKGGDFLSELYVDPDYRRKGIARSLFFEACNDAFEREERKVVLEKLWTPSLQMIKKLKEEYEKDERIEITIKKPPMGMSEEEYHPDAYVYFSKPKYLTHLLRPNFLKT